ncbi:MAG: sulfatase-like hydrolase/transferase, partial [bacterium]
MSKQNKPNIVFVLTDDQGYGDLGCTGNDIIQTPNVDEFYEESVRLTDYHVGPTCAPTRSGLMTGHYANSTGVWHTIGGRSLLRENEWTIASALKENGYQTGIFGKWHLGDTYPYRPEYRGFDKAVVHGGGGVSQTPDYWGNDYFDD